MLGEVRKVVLPHLGSHLLHRDQISRHLGHGVRDEGVEGGGAVDVEAESLLPYFINPKYLYDVLNPIVIIKSETFNPVPPCYPPVMTTIHCCSEWFCPG